MPKKGWLVKGKTGRDLIPAEDVAKLLARNGFTPQEYVKLLIELLRSENLAVRVKAFQILNKNIIRFPSHTFRHLNRATAQVKSEINSELEELARSANRALAGADLLDDETGVDTDGDDE